MLNNNILSSNMIAKEMMPDLNVLGARMLNWILGNLDRTLIVTEKRDVLDLDAIVLQRLLHPE